MKLSNEELEEIIEKDLPGHRMSRKSFRNKSEEMDSIQPPDNEKPEAASPDLQRLREKYFGSADAVESEEKERTVKGLDSQEFEKSDEESEDIIVSVKPKQSFGMRDDSSQLKAAVISGSEKR